MVKQLHRPVDTLPPVTAMTMTEFSWGQHQLIAPFKRPSLSHYVLHFILFLLLHNSRTPHGETYVRQYEATPLLAANCKWYVQNCTGISLMRLEGTLGAAQAEYSAPPSCRIRWPCGSRHLGPLLRTKTGNQHIVIKADRFSKRTLASWTAKIIPMQKATIFLNNWIVQYGINSYELTDNGPQSVNKMFTTV